MSAELVNKWSGPLRAMARPIRELLDHARRSGIVGPQTIRGNASLCIDLNGFPRGTRTLHGKPLGCSRTSSSTAGGQ